MHDTLRRHRYAIPLAIACAVLTGCSSNGPPEFGGRWQPLNRFAVEPQAIPIAVAPAYRATPVDRTLRTLLGRWATIAGLRLEYALHDDYLLHASMAGVGAPDLPDALRQVEVAYATQGLVFRVDDGRLQAQRRQATVDATTASTTAGGG